MDDLDMLVRDFGFGPRGKSKPMRSAQSDRRSIDEPLFSDVFGGPAKYENSSKNNVNHSSMDNFDYDSIFNSSSESNKIDKSSGKTSSSVPVYDKPVYDEDIFDGLPGLKSKSASSTVRFEDNVFASVPSPPSSKGMDHNNDFGDLFGNLGRNEKAGRLNSKNASAKSSSSSKGFDDLLAGFGSGNSGTNSRAHAESYGSSIPTGGSKHMSALDDPLVAVESSSDQGSLSSGVYADPLGEISKLGKSRSTRAETSAGAGGAFDDIDPLNSFGKPSTSLPPGRDKTGKYGSPSRSATPQYATTREQKASSSFRYSESNMEKKIPLDNFQEPPSFDLPNVSTDFQKSVGQNASAPRYYETGAQVDMSPTSGQGQQSDDVWLTVSEIPLFTQPTSAPPPSRPPPPLPRQAARSEGGSFSTSSRKKAEEFSSLTSYGQHSQSPKPARPAAKAPPVSQFDELEDFAMGRSQNSVDERVSPHSSEENNEFSAAAASAAAMKDAMDKAEAKFRHAKEVREREYSKAARHKESVPLENDGQERELREMEDKLDRERKQKEEEAREQRRIERERERSREIEREKARQAVERATREARERAAVEARERAAAEARLKAERAAVEKANAEARGRAERVAVQRAQAEARERAAAEAKVRAERAAAEARERAAAAEASEKAAMARDDEARRRAERASVERAAAEARQRAAAEVQERASTAAKINQQNKNDDLESFFNMGRASSAPRPRSNSTAPLFDEQFQNKGGFEAAKRTSSSSGAPTNIKKASSTTNIVDDLSSIFGAAPSSGGFQDVEGETEERRRARLDRHQRTQERAAKALAEKNQRDLQALREQEERHRISETLDTEIKRWAAGKEGNLRALLSTMQYVLWPECGWQPVSLTDLITGASVKKVYRKATLCIHPDKVQQKGATLQQKYIAEKVFDLLKEAWNKFNSEELF